MSGNADASTTRSFSTPRTFRSGETLHPDPREPWKASAASDVRLGHQRGHRSDFDRWARQGATGWAYADVLRYFRRSETWEGGEDPWRGGSGPRGSNDPIFGAWLEAGRQAGWPVTDDHNGLEAVGLARVQFTIGNGRRASASNAYSKPALNRSGLSLLTNATVTGLTSPTSAPARQGVRWLINAGHRPPQATGPSRLSPRSGDWRARIRPIRHVRRYSRSQRRRSCRSLSQCVRPRSRRSGLTTPHIVMLSLKILIPGAPRADL